MTKLLISTALAGLLAAGGAAFAQDRRDNDHPPAAHAAPPAQAPRTAAPQAPRGPAPATHHDDHRGPPAGARTAPPAGQPNSRRSNGPGTNATPRFAPGANGAAGAHSNFSNLQRNFSAPRRFHAPVYRRPSGWYARRWVFGDILPPFFWASDYWLNDFDDYGLAPPPPGTVWVRDGDDALLIDRSSGEVIQVEYGVFY